MQEEEKVVQSQEEVQPEKNIQVYYELSNNVPSRFIIGEPNDKGDGQPSLVQISPTVFQMVSLEYQEGSQQKQLNGFTEFQVLWTLVKRFEYIASVKPSVEVNTIIKDLNDAMSTIPALIKSLQTETIVEKVESEDTVTVKESPEVAQSPTPPATNTAPDTPTVDNTTETPTVTTPDTTGTVQETPVNN